MTAGVYETEMSREIMDLYDSGKSIEAIAEFQGMTVSNVYAYLPYGKVVYNLEEKSTEAERQKRYRERKQETALVDEKLIAWMNFFEGMTYEEIADDENCKHPAVIKSVKVALDKLKEILVD